ncbi:MAG TPA: hypothetical protein VKU00_22705 [Chthonomonadaceae bacterium]|nr:hypothetical protein [Chthonomonadaceae bacterium]
MKCMMKKLALGMALCVLAGIGLVGCQSDPPPTPVNQRKPGQDISPEDRKDKQGDVKTGPTGQ